ncbi:MAG TPA: ABC transporter substrate-binding protein [Chthonomonadaceae bacterium]|nr:ABC transporter substrate-binding protein [Chthonomonadaceae bacterium]
MPHIVLPRLAQFARCAAAAAALLLLPGCGNSPYAASDADKPVFYTVFGDDPLTMDPSIAYDFNSEALAALVYPSFYQYHYLKRNPLVLLPALGAADPKVEAIPVREVIAGKAVTRTGQRWTFRIRPGVHFQDDPCFAGGKGREVVAIDFLNAFRRMADPRVSCPVYAYFGDKILGMAAFRERIQAAGTDLAAAARALRTPIEGLQTDPADPYTFRIVMDQPYPQLRFLMALPFTGPLAEEVLDRYADERVPPETPDLQKLSQHPVGCGPFMLTEYTKKSRIVLKPNPNRRIETYPTDGDPGDREAGLLEDAGRQLPFVSEIQVNIVRESITSFNQFMQGYIDSAGIGQSNFQEVMAKPGQLSPAMRRRGVQLVHAKNYEISYFAFNMRDPTYGGYSEKNRKLRQSISLSVDSGELIDLFYLGLGVPGQSMLPPGLFGYDPGYRNPYRQFDPSLKRARQLLAEAGYKDGIDPTTGRPLVLNWDNANTTPAGRQFTGLAVRQIQRLGIDVESHSFLGPVITDRTNKGQCQFMGGLGVWGADYPDPENFVFLLYGPNAAVKASGPNISNYSNPEYDRLFERMRVMRDGPERLAIIRTMRAIVQEDCPVIPVRHTEAYGMLQPWLHNYKVHPVAVDTWKFLRVDTAQREAFRSRYNAPNYLPLIAVAALLVAGALPAARVVSRRTNRRVRRNRPGAETALERDGRL